MSEETAREIAEREIGRSDDKSKDTRAANLSHRQRSPTKQRIEESSGRARQERQPAED